MQMSQERIIPRWTEWVPLATQRFRLRKLIQILAMNVGAEDLTGEMCRAATNNDNKGKRLYYYTLHATALSAPFFTSEKSESGCPKWKEFDPDLWANCDVFSGTEALVLRLWCHSPAEASDEVITVWGVHLSGLMLLGQHLSVTSADMKPNTFIFLLPGGYYTNPDYVVNMENRRHISVNVAKDDVRLSYSIVQLNRLQSLQRKIRQRNQECDALKEKILSGDYVTTEKRGSATLRKILNRNKSKNNHLEVEKLKKLVELERFRVQTLREERVIQQDRVNAAKERLEALCDRNQMVESRTMEKYRLLQREVTAHREWLKKHVEQRETHVHARALLNIRIKQLISELNYIYPVGSTPDRPDFFTICGVHLPDSENFAGVDEVQLSVGLGFVAHTVQMISIFLQVPLRYPIVHFGSRSRIIDQIADKIPDKEREFPLFCKGQDKLQFNYAVYLLNKNIAQLRCGSGLSTYDLRCTLPNLSSLLFVSSIQPEFPLLSPSSSTLDLVSSLSISSPVEGFFTSLQRMPSRIQRVSEPTVSTIKPGSICTVGHRITKSAGSAKDLQLTPVTIPPVEDQMKIIALPHNLSYSLDKGLDEFKEITRIDEAEALPSVPLSLGSSETSLPACLSKRNSLKQPACLAEEASTSDFLKNWEADTSNGIFSEDDSDLNSSEILVQKAINGGPKNSAEFSVQNVDKSTENDQVSVGTEVCDDSANLSDENDRLLDAATESDPLMANVTNRAEVLASNSSTFNIFRSRFRANLGGTN